MTRFITRFGTDTCLPVLRLKWLRLNPGQRHPEPGLNGLCRWLTRCSKSLITTMQTPFPGRTLKPRQQTPGLSATAIVDTTDITRHTSTRRILGQTGSERILRSSQAHPCQHIAAAHRTTTHQTTTLRTTTRRKSLPDVGFLGQVAFFIAVGCTSHSAAAATIMVLLDERISGIYGTTATETLGHAENILAGRLRAAGYTVVDPATVRANLLQTKGLRLLEGDDKAAVAIGLQHEADYSVLGTALSKPAATKLYGTRMQTLQASISVRVVRNGDAQTVAQASGSATKAHIDEVTGGGLALEAAAKDVADQLTAQLAAVATATTGLSLTVNISGLVSIRHLDFIMSYLEKEVAGVTSVSLGSFTEGIAVVRLTHATTIESIARAVANRKFTGFRLEPTAVSGGRMDLVAVLETQ